MTSITPIAIFREAFDLCTDSHNLKRFFVHDGQEALALAYLSISFQLFQQFGNAGITVDMQHTTSRPAA